MTKKQSFIPYAVTGCVGGFIANRAVELASNAPEAEKLLYTLQAPNPASNSA